MFYQVIKHTGKGTFRRIKCCERRSCSFAQLSQVLLILASVYILIGSWWKCFLFLLEKHCESKKVSHAFTVIIRSLHQEFVLCLYLTTGLFYRRLTFVFGWLGKLTFFICCPGFHGYQALGSSSFFLHHSLIKLNYWSIVFSKCFLTVHFKDESF